MKKSLLYFATFSCVAFLNSCREEIVVQTEENNVQISEGTTKNGRLYFINKESLTATYNNIKNEEDEVIANYIDSRNIISLRPIVTEKNENKIAEKLNKRIALLKTNKRYMAYLASKGLQSKTENELEIADDIDDLEEIVGDDAYAAFLDSRAEIQVADEIYKYTDAGLFIVKDTKYDELSSYLAVHEISDDLLYPTEASIRKAYVENLPSEEVVSVDEDIKYYNARISQNNNGNSIGGVGGNPPVNPTINPSDPMYNYIMNLQNCAPHNGLFDGIFGDSDICIDRYEDRYRVKTKAYNYNYFLVYNLGVKVKHQYKGWTGIWRQDDCQELRLGVISGTFYYDYTGYFNPTTSPNRSTSIYNNSTRLLFNATTTWAPGFYPGTYTMTGYNMQGFPKLFQDDFYIEDILNKYVNFSSSNALVDKAIYSALEAGNKQLTAQYLNKKFWEESIKFLGDTWQSMGRTRPDNNITNSMNVTELGKLLVAKTIYRTATNGSKIEKSFDWGFQIGIDMDSNGHVTPNTSGGGLKKPQEFRVLMYGIAKRNGVWHGSKINTINN